MNALVLVLLMIVGTVSSMNITELIVNKMEPVTVTHHRPRKFIWI